MEWPGPRDHNVISQNPRHLNFVSLHQVWFRKGIKTCETSELESATTGVAWIEMVGEMGMISVGHHDQVKYAGPSPGPRIPHQAGAYPSVCSINSLRPGRYFGRNSVLR
jgi:hypothetical protein